MNKRSYTYDYYKEEIYKSWAITGNKNVITASYNKDELDRKLTDFNNMPYDHRMRADEESIRLFGKTNHQRYEDFNSNFLKKNDIDVDMDYDDTISTNEAVESDLPTITYTEKEIIAAKEWSKRALKTIIYKVESLEKLEELWNEYNGMIRKHQRESDWESLELFGVNNETHYNILKSNFLKSNVPQPDIVDSDNTVTTTEQSYIERKYNFLNNLDSNKDYDYIKESLDDLHYMDVSLYEEALLDNLNNKISNISFGNISNFIDLTEATKISRSDDIDYNDFNNTIKQYKLKPIYIVLVEGTSIFSDAIKKVTNGVFSHAALCFEESLERMYSYNIKTKSGKSGLSIESIKNYNKNSLLGVFAIFVKDKEYKNMKKNIDYFLGNANKTSYSFANILSTLFNIPLNRDFKMVCSQFVDRLLKIANINITNKDSSLVNPNDFVRASKSNKKIYQLYYGKVNKYNKNKIGNFINDLLIKGPKYINESYNIKLHDIVPYLESKEFPAQFDKEGNLLIKNIKKLDYNAEFAKSHKLFLQYSKNNNIDGMKYELSKLWYMNNKLEYMIRLNETNKKAYTPIRALILNDFNKYLNEVLITDKEFNFTEYYNLSPFSDDNIKISNHTLKYTIDIIKNIL